MRSLVFAIAALSATQAATWPATGGPAVVDRLVPYTEADQARLRQEEPPIMDAHYLMPTVAPASCPTRIVPQVFPIMSVNFTDATAYCSSLIATATSTTTQTFTSTAWVIPGRTTLPPQKLIPKFNLHLKVRVHAGKHPMTSVSSACTCLVGSPTAPYMVTMTIPGPTETHTMIV